MAEPELKAKFTKKGGTAKVLVVEENQGTGRAVFFCLAVQGEAFRGE